jgi:Tfp pilus assembly protein PilE
MKSQRGLTLMGMIVTCIVIVFVAIGGLKIAPAYIEFYKVKKAIVAVAQANQAENVANVRRAFENRIAIDDIEAVGSRDLDITKEGNELVISVAYSKRIPLFGNVNVVIDFAASSNQ